MPIEWERFIRNAHVSNKHIKYREMKPSLEDTQKRLAQALNRIVQSQEMNKQGCGLEKIRIKEWPSVANKIFRQLKDDAKIDATRVDSTFSEIADLCGARVTFPFFDWIEKNIPSLRKHLKQRGVYSDLTKSGFPDDNYLEEDKAGYRAYHFEVLLPSSDAVSISQEYLVEIQVMTPLQNDWARVIHLLLYDPFRGKDMPSEVNNLGKAVSAAVHAADRALVNLRKEVERDGVKPDYSKLAKSD